MLTALHSFLKPSSCVCHEDHNDHQFSSSQLTAHRRSVFNQPPKLPSRIGASIIHHKRINGLYTASAFKNALNIFKFPASAPGIPTFVRSRSYFRRGRYSCFFPFCRTLKCRNQAVSQAESEVPRRSAHSTRCIQIVIRQSLNPGLYMYHKSSISEKYQ